MLLPTTCPVCGARGPAPCGSCAAALRPAPPLLPPPGLDHCFALFAYEGAARELVARLKYRNHRVALAGLAAAMALLVPAGLRSGLGAVTWVPTTVDRRRARGFDQGELLARSVARRLGVPARGLLVRHRGPPQTGRSRAERQAGPALTVRRPPPHGLLVVDDVVTSGATMTAAARVLRGAGATTVVGLAAARTPRRVVSYTADAWRSA